MKKYDCLFVGNAIVDVVANVSFEFLKDQNIDHKYNEFNLIIT